MRLFLGFFMTLFAGQLVITGISHFDNALSLDNRKLLEMFLGTVFFQGSAIVWVTLFLKKQNISWNDAFGLGFGLPGKLRAVILGIFTGFFILPVAWILQQICAQIMTWFHIEPETQELVQKLQNDGIPLSHQIYFCIVAIVLAPIAEEIIFRGIIYPTIKKTGYPKLALWGTSLLFAAIHINALSFIPLLILGAVLALLYEKTGNLITPILTHSVFNTANFLLLIFEKPLTKFLERFS